MKLAFFTDNLVAALLISSWGFCFNKNFFYGLYKIKCTYYSSLTHLPIYIYKLIIIYNLLAYASFLKNIQNSMHEYDKKNALANIKETRTAAAYVDINKNLGREFSYNVLS